MTKINKLVCRGFKSFAKHTEFEFGSDFNTILGPNGSGKSNVVDALTFVLGRRSSKSMRAEKAENLIYNGGKTKEPSKNAEVSVHFDNKNSAFPLKAEEVIVTRIVSKNGNSTYIINGKKCTRADVVDMLANAKIDPDGYNIILQGDIIKFVEMATDERRKIIEDIAGIGSYEDKKTKALSDLSKVDEKVKEADIVLSERKTYLRELKKDRDQALEFKGLNDEIAKHKATLLNVQIEQRSKSVSEFDERIKGFDEKIAELQKSINEIKEDIKAKQDETKTINSEIETKGEKDQVKLNREIEQMKVDLATNKTRLESNIAEIKRILERRKELELNNKEINDKIAALEKEKQEIHSEISAKQKMTQQLEKELAEFKRKNKLDEGSDSIEKEISDLDKKSDDVQEKVQKFRLEQQNAIREKDQLEFKLKTLEEQMEKVSGLEKENKSQLQNLKNLKRELEQTSKKLDLLLNEDSSLAGKISKMRQEYEIKSSELAKLEAKNLQIREQSSADRAVSEILAQKNKIKGIYGTVSELGEVDSRYSLALEIAAGNRIRAVVVEDDEVASKCISFLKNNKLGAAIFLPLNKLNVKTDSSVYSNLKNQSGVHGLAINLVKFDPKFSKAFSYVFADTIVVDDINTARKLGIGKYRMITLDGDLMESSGAMRGGFVSKRAGSFKDKSLSSNIDALSSQVYTLQNDISIFQKRRAELDNEISRLRQESAHLEGEIIVLEKQFHLEAGSAVGDFKTRMDELKRQSGQADKVLDKVISDISSANKELADLKIRKQNLRIKITEMRNPAVLAQLAAFADKQTEIKESLIKLNSELSNLDGQVERILGPDIKRTLKVIDDNRKEEDRFRILVEELKVKISEDTKNLSEKEKSAQVFYKQFKTLFGRRDEIATKIQKLERQMDEKDITIRSIQQKLNAVNLDRAKLKAELTGLETEFEHYKGVEVFKSKTNIEELKRTVGRLEAKRENVGNVNMRALEIYEKVEEEYTNLLKKKETLQVERDDILKLIQEIEASKKEIFMKTFEVVNDIFVDFFKSLSTKGEAFLELENSENPFEAGVEIKVRLTGTKFMDIKSLSGGEKTLTALAFIFAIQEHDPASFYILDEVDAALDKHNSEKLAQLIRKYCNRAQYIVISHNDAIISESSKLYGVSMNEHGMSTITTLEL